MATNEEVIEVKHKINYKTLDEQVFNCNTTGIKSLIKWISNKFLNKKLKKEDNFIYE